MKRKTKEIIAFIGTIVGLFALIIMALHGLGVI